MKKLFVSFIAWSLANGLQAQDLVQKMDQVAGAYAATGKFNGTVLVAQKGKIIFEKGYGYRDAEAKLVNDGSSIYQIGSLTKAFTAAIIMQLQEENKLNVQDKLSKYFPGFANGDKITIEHLLTHTSGLYNYTNDTVLMKGDVTKHYSRDEMITLFKKYPSDFEPGSSWNYSNSGYSMLGYIIEQVTKKPYETVVRERILRPLGMNHSGFDFTNLRDAQKTTGYFLLAGNKVNRAPIVDSTIAYSAGSLYSTVEDLYKWERAITTGKLLKPASWQAVFTPVKNNYGYGWGIDTLYGTKMTAHSGGIHGFSSFMLRFPAEELTVIAIDNASHGTGKLARDLAAVALGKPYTQITLPPSVDVDESRLKKLEGEYELAPGFTITITRKGTQLFGQATGQPSFELFAESASKFYLKEVDAKVEFITNGAGEVTELVLYQNSMSPRGKKIK